MTETKPTSPIDTRIGKTPILLIAPHRHSDDENTGLLTKLIAERLDGYAVINECFVRPRKIGKKKDFYDIDEGIADLNYSRNIELATLKTCFFNPIFDFKDKIKATYPKVTVVLIHALDAPNAKDDKKQLIDIIIGIGLSKKKEGNRLTISEEEAVKLESFFLASSIKATIAKGGDYSAWDRYNLNQFFTNSLSNKYYDDNVQSIQLEIRKTGFRDTEENIQAKAELLSLALAKLLNINLPAKEAPAIEGISPNAIPIMPSSGAELPKQEIIAVPTVIENVSTIAETTKPSASPPQATPVEEIDTVLVESATKQISRIFYSNIETALLTVGNYLLETFFGGSLDNVRNRKPTKEKSFHYLIENIRKDDPKAPSQAWIYRSLQLLVEDADMRNGLSEESFYTYRNLLLSHKVLLLPITDLPTKAGLIKEIADNNYTIVQLRERLSAITGNAVTAPSAPKIISQVIKKPEILFSADFSTQLDKASIATLPPKAITKLRTQAQEQVEIMKGEVERYQAYVERYNQLIEDLDTVGGKEETSKGKSNEVINE